MNRLDRLIAVVSPNTALKRQEARHKLNILNSGYGNHGASRTKKSMFGWNFKGGSTNEDVIKNLDTLRQRSRDLFMGGAALATGALKTSRTNVVGTGLKLKPSFDAEFLGLSEEEAKELKRTIEREFDLWADSKVCDVMGLNNFYELQQLAYLSQLMSGDCFTLLPLIQDQNSIYDLRVRVIEADRCCDPEKKDNKDIQGGVEVDVNGTVRAYHFVNQHPLGSSTEKKEWSRVEVFGESTGRRNVLHLMESERPEQRRGVPILAPVIESLKQIGRYTEAELMAAVVSGLFTVFVHSETGELLENDIDSDSEQTESENQEPLELGNGSIINLLPGEKIETANPGRPNAVFDTFVTAILRQVGAALEIPYELLVKHFTASYSASRAALLEAWKSFRMRRTWLASDFCQPIYDEWFGEAVAKGRIHAPGFFDDPVIRKAYTKAEWHGPSPGQIDPLKEVNAAEKRVTNGFSTRERETAELIGGDFEMNHRQLVREKKMRDEAGLSTEGGEKSEQVLEDDQKFSEE
ncbi:phage portal protein [Chengkuizengella axinellae]|uniref:Phage portal protein n=1 Tax=Chengkuizengella axinellae TaxID=3064388 RepID=A0ABT9J6A9_9BACL|nr:phage portal protein [Chengkuizengella sp. 2205SS18-9]MDP5277152.1 phage portal protein [Chengkuizengella sp. 2205SS18-9]